jgi:hypothetical protein
MNGASELLVAVFGERGRHARSAIGVSELPMGIPLRAGGRSLAKRRSTCSIRPTRRISRRKVSFLIR